jgi:hypothetical protein
MVLYKREDDEEAEQQAQRKNTNRWLERSRGDVRLPGESQAI